MYHLEAAPLILDRFPLCATQLNEEGRSPFETFLACITKLDDDLDISPEHCFRTALSLLCQVGPDCFENIYTVVHILMRYGFYFDDLKIKD